MNVDKLLIFDLVGDMAHFRKFYTNSSSLSYAFPPRTTIIGLIAGILGYERDSYYKVFSAENCRIALSIRKPVRKIMQTINYLMTKRIADFNGSSGHTQVPMELVLPLYSSEELRYRIYFWHKNKQLMEELKSLLEKESYIYPPYLGITECIGKTYLIDAYSKVLLELKGRQNKEMELSTIIPIKKLENISITQGLKIMKEDRVPVELNSQRELTKITGYLYEKECKPMKVKIKGEIFKVVYRENNALIEEFGTFMD